MKILYINLFYYPNIIGGTENSLQILAENMARNGNEVCVYTQDGQKGKIEKQVINGVTVIRSYLKSTYKNLKHKKWNFFDKLENRCRCILNYNSIKDLKCIIDEFHPDVIHTNNLLSISYWIWKYAVEQKIVVVHTLRDYWMIDSKFVLGSSKKFIGIIHRVIFRYISNKSNMMVTAPSDYTLDVFRKYGYFRKSKLECVPNCIEYDEQKLKQIAIKKQHRDSNDIKFIYVGKLGEYKGIMLLIKSFHSIKNENISLTICGQGLLENEVVRYTHIDSRIKYRGQLKKNELADEYKMADVIIVPSIWEEPFGRIVIEGAQYALPCIGSNRGGIPEIIRNLGAGLIFDPDKNVELIEAIKWYTVRENYVNDIDMITKSLYKYSSKIQMERFLKVYKGYGYNINNKECHK